MFLPHECHNEDMTKITTLLCFFYAKAVIFTLKLTVSISHAQQRLEQIIYIHLCIRKLNQKAL